MWFSLFFRVNGAASLQELQVELPEFCGDQSGFQYYLNVCIFKRKYI